VIASPRAQPPKSWREAEIVSETQIARLTPPGCANRAIEWTQKIPGMQVTDRPLIDILRYRDTSLWWFIHTLVFSSAKQAILTIERCEQLLKEKSPEEVLVMGLGSFGKLITQVCDRKHVQCTLHGKSGSIIDEALVDRTKILLGRALLQVKEFRRKRISQNAKTRLEQSKRPHILLLSPSANWRSVWSYESEQYERRDIFMGRILREVQAEGVDVTCVDVDYTLNGHVNILRQKILRSDARWVAFEQYQTNDVKSKLRTDPNYEQLRRASALLDRSDSFKKELNYHSVSLWGFMQGRFRRALSGLHALHDAHLIETAREMFRVEQPDAVAMSYETGAYALAAIVAAWERGIPTVGVQHGLITPNSSEYMHPKVARSKSDNGCPIPTKTALGGPYSAEMLTKLSTYPEDSVDVTGYTKHDDLAELKRNESKLDRKRLLNEVGLTPDGRTIMIASGGFHSKYGWAPEYDKEILEALLNISATRSDAQLLVRLHPMEDGDMQREAISRSRGRAAIVKGERNDLLWASDILVTVNSAVALDALILGKPILMLDHASEDVPILDLGSAATFYKLDDLSGRVTRLLETPEQFERETAEAHSEIARHANSVDGRASSRVASLLRQLAEANRMRASSKSL
jgi:hypothetical protein